MHKSKVFVDREDSDDDCGIDPVTATRYSFFSPAILQKFLSSTLSKSKSLGPFCHGVFASILFADISGFTRLSAHLNVECLKRHINTFFTSLLGVVRDCKGDVIKFCGDAVMIIWPVSRESTSEVKAATAYLAASCALRILTECGEYSRVENTYKVLLKLHCGIGSGLIHCMCLGEEDRWEFLISGDPLRQVGAAESEAGIGEVCMSEEAYSLVSDKFPAVEMPEGSMNLVISKQSNKMNVVKSDSYRSTSVQSQKILMPDENDILVKLNSEQSGYTSKSLPTTSRVESGVVLSGDTSTHDAGSFLSKSPITRRDLSSSSSREKAAVEALSDPPTSMKSPGGILNRTGFSFIFSPAPTAPSSPSLETCHDRLDKEFDEAINTVKAYLGDFLRSGYVPARHLFPVLDKFMMEPAKRAIDHDTLNYVAELREVVTLFVEVLGLEDDFNMGFVRRPQRVITVVLQCLNRYKGSLRQFVVDDKGCVIIAAFGLPGSSHEDNPVRAIETATSIRDDLLEMKVDCRIGIAQGSVYCGLVGSDERCEYAMMGSSVNLAARLMGKAESGKILVNHTVHSAAQNHFHFHALQKIKAKGYARLVAVYTPYERIQTHRVESVVTRRRDVIQSDDRGKKSTHLKNMADEQNRVPVAIGRSTELASFKKSFEIYASSPLPMSDVNSENCNTGGSQQAHIVEGVAGVGKTWFLSEVVKIAKKTKGISHVYMCSAYGQMQQSTRFLIIVQLMEQIFGVSLVNKTMTPASGGQSYSSAGARFQDAIVAWFNRNDESDGMIHINRGRTLSNNFFDSTLDDMHERDEKNFTVHQRQTSYDESVLTTPRKRVGLMKSFSLTAENTKASENHANVAAALEVTEFDVTANSSSHHVSNLIPLLSDILPLQIEDTAVSRCLSFTTRRSFTVALILRIFEIALEKSKTVWILENIQWCDAGSIALLNIWLSVKKGGFFLGTIRSEDGNESSTRFENTEKDVSVKKDKLRSQRGKYALKLEEDSNSVYMVGELYQKCSATALHFFSESEILKLVEQTVDPVLLTQYPHIMQSENISCIHKQTNGSPILTHMLLKELEDVLQKGRFSSIVDLPSSYQALILSRFDKLSPTDQIILKVASVIGQNFTQDDLANVLFRCGNINSSQKLADSLQTLVDSHLLQIVSNPISGESAYATEEDTEPSVTYAFVNRGIQDGIYFLMLEGQRKFTHGVIGSMLEEQFEVIYNPSLFMTALNHFLRSDKVEKKFEYLVKAATLSKKDNDHYTAANCFGDLVHLLTEQSVGTMLSTCTKNIGRSGSEKTFPCIPKALLSVKITIGSPHSTLRKQQAIRNILLVPGFGTDKKWLQVSELRSKFSYQGDVPVRAICIWIGEVAKARLNLGDLRSAHNLLLLALFNADMALSSVILDRRHDPLSAADTIKRKTLLAVADANFTDFFASCRSELGRRRPNSEMSQLAESALDISGVAISLSASQNYFHLAFLYFLGGNVDATLYLLYHSRRNLRHAAKCSRNEDGLDENEEIASGIRIDALQAISFHCQGNSAKGRALLMRLIEKSRVSAPQDPNCTYIRLIASAFFEYSDGLFKDVRIRLRKAMNILAMLNDNLMQHLLCLHLAWCSFLAGRLTESKELLGTLMSYAMSTDNTTLLNWGYVLDMMIMVFSGEYAAVEVVAERVRHISRKDTYSAGVSAVVGLALVLQRKRETSLPHIRFACKKLSLSSHCFLSSGILLFISAMAGLFVIDASAGERSRNSLLPTLKLEICDAADRLYAMSQTHSVLKLLFAALCHQAKDISGMPRLIKFPAGDDSNTADLHFVFSEFIFGSAFYHLFSQLKAATEDDLQWVDPSQRYFLKLGTSDRMWASCKKTVLKARRRVFSEVESSLLPHSQYESEIDSDAAPKMHAKGSESKADDALNMTVSAVNVDAEGDINETMHLSEYKPLTILVVDDAATALKITTRTLSKAGYEVTQANNGLEAVEAVQRKYKDETKLFDCILMDLQMPLLDGLGATRRIRTFEKGLESDDTKRQKIIAISINGDDDTRLDCNEAGFDHFMLKPFHFTTFESLNS